MPRPAVVTEPLIKVRTPTGVTAVGLHDVLHLAHAGQLVDLPSMRADQRAPVVTALAIISHLLRKYAGRALSTSDDWLDALTTQFGECLVLVDGSDDQPQFLQPVLDRKATVPFTLSEADHLMPADAHAVKASATGTYEQALFALMCSTWRHHGGRNHYAGARARSLTVLVGDGSSIGSEIVALASAYDACKPVSVGTNASAVKALDHMVWSKPWVDSQPVDEVPFPFIDCRLLRLVRAQDGLLGVICAAGTGRRVETAGMHIDDPHVPKGSDGKTYKLVMSRTWSHRVQHAAVAGSDKVQRPRILDLAPVYSAVRICAIHEEQGKTGGYWEATYRIASGRRIRLGPPKPDDRLATLSQMALDIVSTAEKCLFVPMTVLFDGRAEDAKAYLQRAQAVLREEIGTRSLQVVLDLVDETPDTAREAEALNAMARSALLSIWSAQTSHLRDPIHRARALDVLGYQMKTKLNGDFMASTGNSKLWARSNAILHEMQQHMTPDNRARIRAAGPTLPLDAYSALAVLPHDWTANTAVMSVWEQAVRALGTIRHGGRPLGSVLAETEYPEPRVNALLAAHGDMLVGLVAETVRWLVSHDVESASLTDLVVLGMSDALGDDALHRATVSQIALSFARTQRRDRAA
jgi:hypothetical protein